ncbi:hypothetical protein DPMN_150245 [Dreissena polymorpha]|uniref:Uncharacterized protein n=1 Tax=Dreissena polymorpha TaxID=45954 RepID=A0A9D4FHD0_DREPO|nr:hypothetical protein DPMN_150245 [Dreissena polymorpha]
MFVTAPYKTTIFTHDIGKAFYTATVLNIDGGDVRTISMFATTGFTFTFDATAITGIFCSFEPCSIKIEFNECA